MALALVGPLPFDGALLRDGAAAGCFSAVIAVDAGYAACKANGVVPSVALGDFDSLGFVPADCPVRIFPPEKDESDLELALTEAQARGRALAGVGTAAGEALQLFGFLGGRADHAYAVFAVCAAAAAPGCPLQLFGEGEEAYVLRGPCALPLPPERSGVVSVFAFGGPAQGVGIAGLKYAVEGVTLSPFTSRGLSNEFIGRSAQVRVEEGVLLVIIPREEKA